jgi:outer membrane cobalamin receptor
MTRNSTITAVLCAAMMALFASDYAHGAAGRAVGTTVRLAGQVVDAATGNPVVGASVRIDNSADIAATDEDGLFLFNSVPGHEVALQVTAVGFQSRTIAAVDLNPDQSRFVRVRLEPTIYQLGPIEVTSTRGRRTTDGALVLTRHDITESSARSLPELLEDVPGVIVERSGPGGRANVRIRGSAENQVLVLVDGHKLNAAGDGVADLASVPLEMVERVEIYTGGASAKFGPDALVGAINLVTRPSAATSDRKAELSVEGGEWGSLEYGGSANDPIVISHLTTRFAWSHMQTNGDFDYAYAEGSSGRIYSGIRRNNRSASGSYFGSGRYTFGQHADLSFFVQYFDANRGLPGAASRPDLFASSDDSRLLGSATLEVRDRAGGTFESSISLSEYTQKFVNTEPSVPTAYQFDSRFDNTVLSMRNQIRRRVWLGNDSRLEVDYRRDGLTHDDNLRPTQSMGYSSRHVTGLGLSSVQDIATDFEPINRLTLDAAVRFDYAYTDAEREATAISEAIEPHHTRHWSPAVRLALAGGSRVEYTLSASYGRSLRLPSLNALFWKGDARSSGNPDLKPERSEHSELTAGLHSTLSRLSISASVTYFHASVRDLVIWQPSMGVWTPDNIGAARMTGHEESVTLAIFGEVIRLSYQNAVTLAVNRGAGLATRNKRLPFYPGYVTTLRGEASLHGATLGASLRWTDKTYSNTSNTKYYEASELIDVWCKLEREIVTSLKVWLSARVDNLTDEDYVLMSHYPMPGRHLSVGLGLRFSPR